MTDHLIRPISKTGRSYVVLFFSLGMVATWGLVAWVCQIYKGLGVTGMNNNVNWGVYITNFVFFIGISHAGTLISAILRVSGAEWRRPITRMAESITVIAISVGALLPIIYLGHPDRILNLLFYGRIQSAVL